MKKKKVLSILLTVILTSSIIFVQPKKVSAAIKIPWTDIAWKVIDYACHYYYNRPATNTSGSYYATTSTGTLWFNDKNSNVGTSLYRDVQIPSKNYEFDVFAKTVWYDWSNTISVIVTDSSGRYRINKAVTDGQHAYYTTTSSTPTGKWRVQFVENDHKKWDCWITVANQSARSYSLGSNAYSLKSNKQLKNIKFIDDPKTNDVYTVPSTSPSIHSMLKNSNETSKLSMKDLCLESYDPNIKTYVNALANYSEGDKINFTDTIQEVYYDKKKNATFFVFNGLDNQKITWPFKNDLTGKYKVGDKLSLKLTTVNIYKDNEYTLESLDYIVNSKKLKDLNTFADIKDYQ